MCVALRPLGPGLPGPVTADFPCLSGRRASGRGGWELQSLYLAPVHPPQLSTLDLPLVDPGARPRYIPAFSAQFGLVWVRKGTLATGGQPSCSVGHGQVARDAHGCEAPGQAGEGPEPWPCQSNAQSCAEGGGRPRLICTLSASDRDASQVRTHHHPPWEGRHGQWVGRGRQPG